MRVDHKTKVYYDARWEKIVLGVNNKEGWPEKLIIDEYNHTFWGGTDEQLEKNGVFYIGDL